MNKNFVKTGTIVNLFEVREPLRTLDDRGRLLPLSHEVRQRRSAALNQALDAIAEITEDTDTEENRREALRDLDSQRSHRPLFEGMY